jgi:hypothetical protein
MEDGAVGHTIERGPPKDYHFNFRCQVENQVSDYRLLGASSLVDVGISFCVK